MVDLKLSNKGNCSGKVQESRAINCLRILFSVIALAHFAFVKFLTNETHFHGSVNGEEVKKFRSLLSRID